MYLLVDNWSSKTQMRVGNWSSKKPMRVQEIGSKMLKMNALKEFQKRFSITTLVLVLHTNDTDLCQTFGY